MGNNSDTYSRELDMVEERWRRKDRFDANLKRLVFGDIKIITCIIVLTMAIPNVEFTAKIVDMAALLIIISFGKWLTK